MSTRSPCAAELVIWAYAPPAVVSPVVGMGIQCGDRGHTGMPVVGMGIQCASTKRTVQISVVLVDVAAHNSCEL